MSDKLSGSRLQSKQAIDQGPDDIAQNAVNNAGSTLAEDLVVDNKTSMSTYFIHWRVQRGAVISWNALLWSYRGLRGQWQGPPLSRRCNVSPWWIDAFV